MYVYAPKWVWGGERLSTGHTSTRSIKGKNTFTLHLVYLTTTTQVFSECGPKKIARLIWALGRNTKQQQQ